MSTGVFDSDLVEVVDTTDIADEQLDSGGGMVDKEGKCHLVLNDITKFAKDGELPHFKFDFQCLAHEDPKQTHKMVFYRIYLAKWVNKGDHSQGMEPASHESNIMKLRFARGLGLISAEDLGNPKTSINWGIAKGRQCFTNLGKEERKDKDSGLGTGKFDARIQYGEVYPPGHPSVEGWPADAMALTMAGAAGGGGFGVNVDDI